MKSRVFFPLGDVLISGMKSCVIYHKMWGKNEGKKKKKSFVLYSEGCTPFFGLTYTPVWEHEHLLRRSCTYSSQGDMLYWFIASVLVCEAALIALENCVKTRRRVNVQWTEQVTTFCFSLLLSIFLNHSLFLLLFFIAKTFFS